MKVILKEDHDTLGMKGDVVEVKNGYGQNYLIPRQLAVVATKSGLKQAEEERRQASHKIAAQRDQMEALAKRLEGVELTIPSRTGEDGRLFGTVTAPQIVDALAEKGFDVDRRKVSLPSDIRQTGTYTATIRLAPDLSSDVTVTVVPEQGAETSEETDEDA